MIEAVRRMIGRPDDESRWDVDLEFEPENQAEPEAKAETFPNEGRALSNQTPNLGHSDDHYTNLVQNALAEGGRYGKYAIPEHWLRLMLVGLEGRRMEVESIWEVPSEMEVTPPAKIEGQPAFGDLFPNLLTP